MIESFQRTHYFVKIAFLTLLFLGLQGCSQERQRFEQAAQIAKNDIRLAEMRYENLSTHVKTDSMMGKYETTLRMALDTVEQEKGNNPAFQNLKEQFLKDTTEDGVVFKSIKQDYETFKKNPTRNILTNSSVENISMDTFNYKFFDEISRISKVVSTQTFDEHFVDYINILASMSPNVSPVVVDSVDDTLPVGNQLVGNPNYGEWQRDSSGNSFWAFYGQYAFFSNLFDNDRYGYSYNRAYRYDRWHKNRNWSFYNDKYVKSYESPVKRRQYSNFSSSMASNYKNRLNTRSSPVSKQTQKLATSKSSRFTSSYSKSGSGSASVRSSSSGSRSFIGGK